MSAPRPPALNLFDCACFHPVVDLSPTEAMQQHWQRYCPVQIGPRDMDPRAPGAFVDTISAVLPYPCLLEGTIAWCLTLRQARLLSGCLLARRSWEPVVIIEDMVPALGSIQFGVVTAQPWIPTEMPERTDP